MEETLFFFGQGDIGIREMAAEPRRFWFLVDVVSTHWSMEKAKPTKKVGDQVIQFVTFLIP